MVCTNEFNLASSDSTGAHPAFPRISFAEMATTEGELPTCFVEVGPVRWMMGSSGLNMSLRGVPGPWRPPGAFSEAVTELNRSAEGHT